MDVASTTPKQNGNWWQILSLMVFYYNKKTNNISFKAFANFSLRIILSLLISLSISDYAQAKETQLLIIKSGPATVYNRIIQTVKSHINQTCRNRKCSDHSIKVATAGETSKLRRTVKDTKWDLIITIGTKAAIQLISYKTTTPTVYSLIPSYSFQSIKRASASKNKSAIYIDQPLKRQLQLIKSALPEKKRVGVILGKRSGISKKHLQQTMRNMGLTPVITILNNGDIGKSLKSILNKSDALLANPDPSVYNKKTVMTVLLSSYRYNVPVFGYSAAFVRSGATAAIYSSPMDIGQQIGEEIVNFISSNKMRLSPPGFPKYFSVKTNRQVIRSLNIKMPSSKEIKASIPKVR